MAETINFHDFIEVDYTGKTAEEGIVFDTTIKEVAEKNNIAEEGHEFSPVIICVGEGHLLRGLEKELEGKELGNELIIKLAAENAFGKKDSKQIEMIPARVFLEQKIQPMPGLSVNKDGRVGTIRVVNSGRIIVDFNHPLAGKDVEYSIKVLRKVTDNKEKVASILKILGLDKKYDVEIRQDADVNGKNANDMNENNKIILKAKEQAEIPEEIGVIIAESIKKLLSMEVAFEKKAEENSEKAQEAISESSQESEAREPNAETVGSPKKRNVTKKNKGE